MSSGSSTLARRITRPSTGRKTGRSNLTRADMVAAGWSPSVRLFEAAACGVPILSDRWCGLEELFVPGEEIVLVGDASDVVATLRSVDERQRTAMGAAARRRVLRDHTSLARAAQLENYLREVMERPGQAKERRFAQF